MDDTDDTALAQLALVLTQLDEIIRRPPAVEDAIAAHQQRKGRYFTFDELGTSVSGMHESLQIAHLELPAAAAIVDDDRQSTSRTARGAPRPDRSGLGTFSTSPTVRLMAPPRQ